jgi:hypothetical protein
MGNREDGMVLEAKWAFVTKLCWLSIGMRLPPLDYDATG